MAEYAKRYPEELDAAAAILQRVHPIGRVKAIGRLEVAAALAELFPADGGGPVTPWRPIETLDRDQGEIIICTSKGRVTTYAAVTVKAWQGDPDAPVVTHWMPLPARPRRPLTCPPGHTRGDER